MKITVLTSRATQARFQFRLDKDTISSQKRLCLSVFFAHRGKMEVKVHKTLITVDTETCFALNYQKSKPSELAVSPSHDAIPVARDAIRVARDGGNLFLSDTVHT